jgi:hypothetical protein
MSDAFERRGLRGEIGAFAAGAAPFGGTEIRGARMLQHAERVMSAVDPDTNGSADSRLRALMV